MSDRRRWTLIDWAIREHGSHWSTFNEDDTKVVEFNAFSAAVGISNAELKWLMDERGHELVHVRHIQGHSDHNDRRGIWFVIWPEQDIEDAMDRWAHRGPHNHMQKPRTASDSRRGRQNRWQKEKLERERLLTPAQRRAYEWIELENEGGVR